MPITIHHRVHALGAVCAVLVLSGCGGGDGLSPSQPPDDSTPTAMEPPPPAVTMEPPPPPPMEPAQLTFPGALNVRAEMTFAARLNTPDDMEFETRKAAFEESAEYLAESCSFFCLTKSTDQSLALIKAGAAYARGATGEGEVVAVTDSGIRATHREFALYDEDGNPTGENKATISSQSEQVCKTDPDTMVETCGPYAPVEGELSHGTSVASIIAGARDLADLNRNMQGVAHAAALRFHQIKLGSGSGDYEPFDLSEQDEAFDMMLTTKYLTLDPARSAGAAVINFSFGVAGVIDRYDADEVRTRFRHTAAHLAQAGTFDADKIIVVWAAGNAHKRKYSNGARVNATSVELWSGLGAYFPELQSHVLAVVATDQDGEIASFSNRCGIAKDFCIAAPGKGIAAASWSKDDSYTGFLGTSAAAPIVSGSLALLRQYFRGQLGNTEIVTRLLATADRTGTYANSDIYGHGMVDLDAATAPVGAMMTALPGDPDALPFSIDGGGFALSGGAFGAAMQDALAGVEIAAFDQLGAPFFFPATGRIAQAARVSDNVHEHEFAIDKTQRASLSLQTESGALAAARIKRDGWWLAYGHHGGREAGLYAADAADIARQFRAPLAFASPYLSLVRDGPGIGWSNQSRGGARFGFSLMHGAPQFDHFANPGGARGIGALLDYRPRGAAFSLQAGAVHEADGFLGARAHGDFGQFGADTAFAGIGGNWAAPGDWRFLASAYLGHTRANAGDSGDAAGDGMLRAADDILSSAFSFGMARASLARRGDWLGLRLSQPLRAESGAARLRLPAGRTKYGEVVHHEYDVGLAPSGRNLQVEAAYRMPFAGGALSGRLGIERHALHDRAREPDGFLRLSFDLRF